MSEKHSSDLRIGGAGGNFVVSLFCQQRAVLATAPLVTLEKPALTSFKMITGHFTDL